MVGVDMVRGDTNTVGNGTERCAGGWIVRRDFKPVRWCHEYFGVKVG